MVVNMKIARILRASLRQSIIYEMQYRVNFFINAIATLGWTFLSFLTVDIIGARVTSISTNWSKDEYILLWGIASVSINIFIGLCKRNLEKIPDKVLHGELDFLIVKPFNSKLLASIGYTRFGTLPAFILRLYLTLISLANIQNGQPFWINLSVLVLLLVFATIVYYSLYTIVVSLSFWLIGAHNLTYFAFSLSNFAYYPIKSFGTFFSFIFTFIFPLAFLATFPAEAIIEVSVVKVLLVILVAIITYKVSDIVWNLGLRQYESASS